MVTACRCTKYNQQDDRRSNILCQFKKLTATQAHHRHSSFEDLKRMTEELLELVVMSCVRVCLPSVSAVSVATGAMQFATAAPVKGGNVEHPVIAPNHWFSNPSRAEKNTPADCRADSESPLLNRTIEHSPLIPL